MSHQHKSLLELLKFLEANEMPATFWFKKGDTVTGIPKYHGFDIDIGEIFVVGDRKVALHDFRTLLLANPDNHLYREHHL